MSAAPMTDDDLISIVLRVCEVRLSVMREGSRLPHVSLARHFACWFLRKRLRTFQAIADALAMKNHDSAMHGVARIERDRHVKDAFGDMVRERIARIEREARLAGGMISPVRLWRYYLPNESPLEGWAEIVIASSGFFAAVSDYGNYAYAWRDTGCVDVRNFFARERVDACYMLSKLAPQQEYDQDATVRAVKRAIIHRRRREGWSADEARAEWDRIDRYDGLYSREDVARWADETALGQELYNGDLIHERHSPAAVAFCKRVLPRLAALIRAELESEARGAA